MPEEINNPAGEVCEPATWEAAQLCVNSPRRSHLAEEPMQGLNTFIVRPSQPAL